jgi:hypothetical protein
MAHTDPAYKAWATLREQWHIANQAARTARFAVTRSYMDCANGKGAGPTEQAVAECDRLERLADTLSIEMDQLIKNAFA